MYKTSRVLSPGTQKSVPLLVCISTVSYLDFSPSNRAADIAKIPLGCMKRHLVLEREKKEQASKRGRPFVALKSGMSGL